MDMNEYNVGKYNPNVNCCGKAVFIFEKFENMEIKRVRFRCEQCMAFGDLTWQERKDDTEIQ